MPAYRLDLHTHLKPAKRAMYRPSDAERYADTLERRRLDGLAVTEHAHAHGFWAMYESLVDSYEYRDGGFDVAGRRFFPGMEVTLAERVDVLVIAPLEELRRLDYAFPTPLSLEHHPTGDDFADTVDRLRLRALRIAAHPFAPEKTIMRLAPSTRRWLFHALEINAKHCDGCDAGAVQSYAHEIGCAVTGGSDAHASVQLGAVSTLVSAADDSMDALIDAVASGRAAPVVHPDAASLVDRGREMRRRLKALAPRAAGRRRVAQRAA